MTSTGSSRRSSQTPRRGTADPGMDAPLISFLSDYGLGDEFVGICHGVIAQA
jgi:hypothetical protein